MKPYKLHYTFFLRESILSPVTRGLESGLVMYTKKRDKMQEIRIKNLLRGTEKTSFIEFESKGKLKILSFKNFTQRYGDIKKYIK